jgi:hypothetical protein
MTQLLCIDLQKKQIKVVGNRRFLAEFTYDDLADVDPDTLEQIRTGDYSKVFEAEK